MTKKLLFFDYMPCGAIQKLVNGAVHLRWTVKILRAKNGLLAPMTSTQLRYHR